MKVAIIGAGPSGLVSCKSLLEASTPAFPFDPVVLEQESDIGGTFKYRSYEEYVDYLRAYCENFDIYSRINFHSKVVNVQRNPSGGHLVAYVQKDLGPEGQWSTIPTVIHVQYVVVCTGLHVIPSIPSIPGVKYFADAHSNGPTAIHSHKYKSRSQIANKRVMILGTGETGLDIAYEAVKAGATEVTLCSRSGFLSFPKVLNDFEIFGFKFQSNRPVPIDTLITNLAETAYVHPWVSASHIRWFISDFVIKRVLWLLTGTQAGCNQWVGELEPKRLGRAYVFLNKSHKAMPYINRPYRNRPWFLEYLSRYIDPPEDTPPTTDFVIQFAPFPTSFTSNGRAVFPESSRKDAIRIATKVIEPEMVIFATGYTQNFDFLDGDSGYATPCDADMRDITKTGDETVAFIGFVRPGVGAIPPLAEMQIFFWISVVKGEVKRPLTPPYYHLLVEDTARIKYGVDHSAYMSTLAKDIGAAPGLWELWRDYGWHILVCYCFGAAFTSFYRLFGPFRSPTAPKVIKTEIWDTILRRGVLGNIVMGTYYGRVQASGMLGRTVGREARAVYPSDITAFSNTSNSNVVAATTADMNLLYINSMTGASLRQSSIPSVTGHLQASHTFLLSGSSDGYLRTHDPRSNPNRASENQVKAHTGGIQGLETTGNFAFTIGLGERQSRPFPDPLVKIYDLRTMRSLPPIAFSSGPAFLQVLPKRASTIAIVSSQGLVNVVDILNPTASEFYQLDLASYITSCAVSPTAAYMAFGDAEGVIHLLSQAEEVAEVPFNGFDGKPIEWADAPDVIPEINWTDSTPLNVVGLPHYDAQLLSAWTPLFEPPGALYPPPPKIPAQVLSAMKKKDDVGYASLPRELKGRRNMVSIDSQSHNGRFRSAKPTKVELSTKVYNYTDNEVPQMYRQVEIEYSKFGVEDFDFGFYNKTEYSGLETHILNSYTNSILQVMHYCLPIRILAKSHITTNCPREHCLLCELGFVVRMLEDARGTNCQSSNFCKAVGVLAQASNSIELVDYGRDGVKIDYAHTIQKFHHFLIEHLSSEGNVFPLNPSLLTSETLKPVAPHTFAAAPITQLVGLNAITDVVCTSCGNGPSNESQPATDFTNILRYSLFRDITHKATCQKCRDLTNFTSRRSISSEELPPILGINACILNDEHLNMWMDVRGKPFLQSSIRLHGQVHGVDDTVGVEYCIRSLVVQIMSKHKHSHLVAIVKVPQAETDGSPWFIFNDFMVRNITEEEALCFPDKWKVPAIVYYERSDLDKAVNYTGLPNSIDETILCHDTSISLNRDPRLIRHDVLQLDELPRPGTVVAIDAEFVSMQQTEVPQEETEYRSDGTNKVLRPARLSLARVSVLRGDGPKQGRPFIDDHIHTIGDLDPHLSRHTLTPLKLVYKKLRVLVDRGCIFIGHGLSKDFRIIRPALDIFVPPEQVIDTVDLYFMKSRQRRLSLRFLSWLVLHEQIQADTHDSIEDARSALKLYNAYSEFEAAGTFDQKLDELYAEGRLYNFRPPKVANNGEAPDASLTSNPTGISQSKNAGRFRSMHSNSPRWQH
ncbi:hypothetical protein H0H93_012148 [Arthromyces matolae]|nr:hypothetical protein H0H93_012148 [Arthromyces matolae]